MIDTLKLRGLLLTKGYSQKDLAKYLGLSVQSINLKINNKRYFKINEIIKVCHFLKIESVEEIHKIFFANNVDLNLQND